LTSNHDESNERIFLGDKPLRKPKDTWAACTFYELRIDFAADHGRHLGIGVRT
jgi:hypothetical protein